MLHKLVLLRHGESEWNLQNRFTGWKNVDLTNKGIKEAKTAGALLKEKGYSFDLVYTSLLKRAEKTMKICLNEMKNNNYEIHSSWRLNERHYGKLQGLNKKETAKKFGSDKVIQWRRSYDVRPPTLSNNDKRHPKFESKYININLSQFKGSESLKDTINRVIPIWENKIKKSISSNKSVLIVAHGNSLRALIKYLDNISETDIMKLNIPTGIPLIYELDQKLNPIKDYYLGNEIEIENQINKVASQSRL